MDPWNICLYVCIYVWYLNPLTLVTPKVLGYGACTHSVDGDRMLPTCAFHKPFKVKFPDKCEWQNRFNSDNKEGMGWYIDGSKTNISTGAGVQKRSTATPRYSRLKYIPSRLA
jgi:hypothetical protein